MHSGGGCSSGSSGEAAGGRVHSGVAAAAGSSRGGEAVAGGSGEAAAGRACTTEWRLWQAVAGVVRQ